ncbi:unnamed protein product [Clonostachys rosea f. rosea IK726]|uniref:Uncharacterized protein n=1 Tax=Clonostachys rosea f. rosea IK726 TaxID=1349383 RepID=A0ACA9UTH4_BIOOC|nr:unnamed protein product [Clonostachys rosea f. rosea IK726]
MDSVVATTASYSLVTFNQNTREFGDMLIKMAFCNDSSSSKAVLFALLALASRYRNGLQSQAVQFKTAAITELTRSAERSSLSTTEAAQHVAAGMLLCSFEIHDSSETGGQWLWYVRGVKDIIKVSRLDEHADKRFVSEMLEWVHYHDVVAQFSILHWRHRQVENIFAEQISTRGQADLLLDSKGAHITNPARPSHRVLQFLTEIFNVLFQAFEHKDKMENYVGILTALEGNARTIVEVSENYDAQMNNTATNPIKLYQIAILIYLARVSESISGKPRDIQGLIDKAFTLLDRLWAHEHQFPLLIVGSEARTDEQRAIILNLVKRSETNRYGRSLDCLRWGLHALWIQEDLAADQEIVPSYVDRFNAIMSKTRFIPSLA